MQKFSRIIKNMEISFNGNRYTPGFQKNSIPTIGFEKTLKTVFKNEEGVLVNDAASGIGVEKDGIRETWILKWDR
jgi:hypothetical protein